jgi:hypothetical protein
VPEDDQAKPTSTDDERLTDDLDSADADPADEDVQTSFARMIGVLQKTAASREEISNWMAAWLPLIVALKGLASTAVKLAWRARQLVDRDSDEPIFDREMLDKIQADFGELTEVFPEASALFFGVDDIDEVVRETLKNDDARAVVARFGRVVEAKMGELITRLVEWGLEDGGAPGLSVERLEGFVHGLERLLQEVMERWVLPRVYEKFDE